jgi:hypothetical protein
LAPHLMSVNLPCSKGILDSLLSAVPAHSGWSAPNLLQPTGRMIVAFRPSTKRRLAGGHLRPGWALGAYRSPDQMASTASVTHITAKSPLTAATLPAAHDES